MKSDSQPLVSIVIPCYNHEKFVQECIQSVIDQSYQNIELIIIDDGSKDNSVQKIQEMIPNCEQRFARFEFRHRPNKGLSATLNEALGWCEGKYFSPLASDDIILSHKIKLQVDLIEKNDGVVGVFGAVQEIDEQGLKGKVIEQRDKVFNFSDLLFTEHYLPAPSQLLNTNAIRNVGGFKNEMIIEDWYIYLKLMENGNKLLFKNELVALYRMHGKNMTSNFDKMMLGYLQVLNEFDSYPLVNKARIKVYCIGVLVSLKNNFLLTNRIMFQQILKKLSKGK